LVNAAGFTLPHYPDNYSTQKKKSYQDKYSGIFLPFVYIAAFFYF
jgi:hypothetical protein